SREMMIADENSEWLGIPRILLMENAGANVARAVYNWIGTLKGVNVVVFCGPGNNGGDGMAAARHLASMGANTTVILLSPPEKIRTPEARKNLEIVRAMKESVKFFTADDVNKLQELRSIIEKAEAIVDAIFGTGVRGKIKEPYRTAIQIINSTKAFKLSVDIPSGINPDTGEVEDIAVKADMSITFHRIKKGIPASAEYCGEVIVASIGIPLEAELLMGPGDLQDALIDLSQESKPIGLISPGEKISEILDKLGSKIILDKPSASPIVYIGEGGENLHEQCSGNNIIVTEGLGKESTIAIVRDLSIEMQPFNDRLRKVRELAVEQGKVIYHQSHVDVVSDGDRVKASWVSRPLGVIGSSTLRAMTLFFLSHDVDPFRACCAAGYLAGYVEENGLEKLSPELEYRKSRIRS
ncbi:MAG: NAD(P)H-hydrate epimerase, partial [Nitrososphaerota archaeon]